MRVVFLALLAVGALHGLPLEQSSGLESSVSDASSVVLEGSGNVANKVDTASGNVIDVALDKIPPRSKRDDASATTTTEATTTFAGAILEEMDFGEEEEGEGELRRATKKLKKAQRKLTNETESTADWLFEIKAADIGNGTVKSAVNELDDAVEEGSALLEDNNVSATTNESSNTTCEALRSCHDDSDCNGGRCLGAFLGTCNCNSCMSFWRCTSDSDCGGFKQACNTNTGMCDCFGAYVLNGFKDTMDALSNLCNVKKCGRDTAADDCFGLPCNTGNCFC